MFFTIVSTIMMGGAAFYAYEKQTGNFSSSDHEKIQKIFNNCNLNAKGETIQIMTKRRIENGMEYVYRLPLGLSFDKVKEHQKVLENGVNIKSTFQFLDWQTLKSLKLNKSILTQIKALLKEERHQKELTLEYDGMLKIKVYNNPLTKDFEWKEDDFKRCKDWEVPIGIARSGLIKHDFEKRPHMIDAGATGFGKSEFIKIIVCVLTKNQPNKVRFHLIDLKGGTELGPFKNMKQVEQFGRDPKEAKAILEEVQQQMNEKLDYLFENGLKDVKHAGQKERDFVIIDEAADIANDKECMELVTDIARRGRAAGYRLIYATQYPTNETLPSQVRANIGARVCFRLETGAQSRAVLDEDGAEKLPEIEGRAIFRRVTNHTVQTPYMKEKTIKKVIEPHIVIKAREEGVKREKGDRKATTRRADTFEFEKTRLS